jgi:transposase-like protein
MVEGLSLPKIAKLMKIHVSTAFYWRHKILMAIQKLGNESLTGIVESDETFFLESQKGKKVEHRKPRKRGGSSKYRGISHEQVCVVVAIDRSNNVVSEVAGNGRISSKALDKVLGGHISKASSLCTDSTRNYKKFAKDKGLEHHAINAKKGIYHVQHVNAYHSRLKIWMDRFQGVATKYLNHYLYWFRFLENVKKLSSSEKKKTMLIHACCEVSKTTVNSFRQAS